MEFENAALFCRLGLPPTLIRHENGALFRRLGLPPTLVRHENGAFRKRSSNRKYLKTPAFCFRMDLKHFENGAFGKRRRHDDHVIYLTEFSSNANLKGPVIVAFLNSSSVVWRGSVYFRCKVLFANRQM